MINIKKNNYRVIEEIWEYSSNSILIYLKTNKVIKVTALRNILGEVNENYDAYYEELVTLTINSREINVWAEMEQGKIYGDTIEECLQLAIKDLDLVL